MKQPDVSLISAGLLGASPSAIGPFFALSDEFFQNCDYCLIDLCVIDLTVVDLKSADPVHILQWVEWIGHMARRNGCQPIFVLIPVIEYATRPHPVFDLYRTLIREQQYLYLDVRDLIQHLCRGDTSAIGGLYKDAAHLGSDISRVMAGILMALFESDRPQHYRNLDVTFAFRDFRRLRLQDLAPSEVARVSHKTGLMYFDGIRLTAHHPLQLEVGHVDKLHAVMVNAARSYRKLALHGDDRVVKSFSLRAYFDVPFEARLIPIGPPVRDHAGTITLSIAADDEPTHERTMHEVPIATDVPRSVEFSDLLVETGIHLRTYPGRVAGPERMDLVALYAARVVPQSSMA